MSQQSRLEKVLDLLLSENSEQASEMLHQIIVDKARTIYESIVDEEDVQVDESEDEVGGDPEKNFTQEIATDHDDIDGDEEFDGEPEDGEEDKDSEEDEFDGDEDGEEESTEERIEDLESQLAELRAEFDELMGEELQEPEHADLAAEYGEEDGEEDGEGSEDHFEPEHDEFQADEQRMFEKKKADKKAIADKKEKLEKASQAKDKKKDKKVDEETQFTTKVADTGQRGTAKLVGTGKGMSLGAEQTKSSFTNIPARKDYGGKPAKIGAGTGGEYGKWNGESAESKTPSDNVKVEPKKDSTKADTTAKYTGGKAAGEGGSKTPFLKKPS